MRRVSVNRFSAADLDSSVEDGDTVDKEHLSRTLGNCHERFRVSFLSTKRIAESFIRYRHSPLKGTDLRSQRVSRGAERVTKILSGGRGLFSEQYGRPFSAQYPTNTRADELSSCKHHSMNNMMHIPSFPAPDPPTWFNQRSF